MKSSRYEPSPEGALMHQFRARADLPQREVAAMMGMSYGAFGLIENGLFRPSERHIRAFAVAMKLTLAEEQQILDARAQAWKQPVLTPSKVESGRRHLRRLIERLPEEQRQWLRDHIDDVVLATREDLQESLAQLRRGEVTIIRPDQLRDSEEGE